MKDASGGQDSDPGDSGQKIDAGDKTDAGNPDAGCNTLVNSAPEATSSTVASGPPAAGGGTIADGTYFLSEFNLYDPTAMAEAPSPSGMKTTLVIKSGVMDSVMDFGDGEDHAFSETFTVDNADLNRMLTCPKSGPDLDATYTVDGNKLVIYETDPQSEAIAASVYLKQ